MGSWVLRRRRAAVREPAVDLAQVVWPSLTTIRQPIRDLGYAAADLLLEFGETIERRQLPHELIVRGSTAPPQA